MGENKDNNKFYFFKIDKDKIKLQLKNISSKFVKPKKNRKLIFIIITFCLLVGVVFALYNNNFNSQLTSDSFTAGQKKEKTTPEVNQNYNNNVIDLNNKPLSKPKSESNQSSLGEEKESDKNVEKVKEVSEGVVTEPVTEVKQNMSKMEENIELLKPVAGQIIMKPGWYFHPVFADWRYQKGIKLEGNVGDVVMAAEAGEVTKLYEDQYKGIVVEIKHNNGWKTLYGYLEKTPLVAGEVVGKGQEVGRIGTTGITEQPCLYFELLNDGKMMDPCNFIN